MDARVNKHFPTAKLDVPSDQLRSIYKLCEQFPSLAEFFDMPKPFEFVAIATPPSEKFFSPPNIGETNLHGQICANRWSRV
jgi:hypothetical protein